MKKYREFFIHTIILTAIVAITVFAAANLIIKNCKLHYKNGETNTLVWLQTKEEINKKLNKKDTVVLLGGSNVLFGTNSYLIEKETGLNIINMGTHGGLEDYTLHWAKRLLKPGNIVIIPLEFNIATKYNGLNNFKAEYILANDKEYYSSLKLAEKIKYIQYFLNHTPTEALTSNKAKIRLIGDLKDKNRQDATGNFDKMYNQIYWNDKGDVTTNFGQNTEVMESLKNSELHVIENPQLSPVIVDFAKWCKNNNIKVYFTYPIIFPYTNRNSKEVRDFFDKYKEVYRKNDIEFIGNAEDSYFEYDEFVDTVYHLNQKGKRRRSKYLSNLIKEVLP